MANVEENNTGESGATARSAGQSSRVVQYISVAVAIVAGLTLLLKELPDLFFNGKQAYVALVGMFSHGSSSTPTITPGPLPRPDGQLTDVPAVPGAFNMVGPGPKPSGDCSLVPSSDFTVTPPVYRRSWECK
jgi:hypothetical protein